MNITKIPVAYKLTNNSAIIWWETDSNNTAGHGVNVATPGTSESFIAATSTVVSEVAGQPRSTHYVQLNDLPENTMFTFRVVGPGFLAATQRSYTTHGSTTDLVLGVLNSPEGFFSSSYPQLQHTIEEMGEVGMYLSCGGIAKRWGNQSYEDWAAWYTAISASILDKGMLAAKGDDDYGVIANAMFPSSTRSYYAESIGRARIVVLDTTSSGRPSLTNVQRDWAINEFNSTAWKSASYRIILGHNPFRVSLWDQSKSFGNGTGTDRFLLTNLYPLVKQSGADLALFGQAHSYQRGAIESIYPDNEGQITYHLVCGGISPAHTVKAWTWGISDPPGIIIDSSDHHFVTISMTAEAMTVVCKNTSTGNEIDSFAVTPHTLF